MGCPCTETVQRTGLKTYDHKELNAPLNSHLRLAALSCTHHINQCYTLLKSRASLNYYIFMILSLTVCHPTSPWPIRPYFLICHFLLDILDTLDTDNLAKFQLSPPKMNYATTTSSIQVICFPKLTKQKVSERSIKDWHLRVLFYEAQTHFRCTQYV